MISARDISSKAYEMRRDVVSMIYKASSGHIGSALGLAEFFSTMYMGGVLKYNPSDPWWEGRDRLIVSNGHVCPIWYTALSHAGFFPREDLSTYSKTGSLLQGHPHIEISYEGDRIIRNGLAGIENSGGSLGQGISLAVGMGLGLKSKESDYKHKYGRSPRVFCLMSDAETQEGQTWEAFQFAVMEELSNVTFILDRNNILIDDEVDDVSPIEPLTAKLESFGLYVLEVNGHDPDSLREAFETDLAVATQPVVVVMHTTPGKGVSFMEDDFEWHDKVPSEEEYKKAIKEIERHL